MPNADTIRIRSNGDTHRLRMVIRPGENASGALLIHMVLQAQVCWGLDCNQDDRARTSAVGHRDRIDDFSLVGDDRSDRLLRDATRLRNDFEIVKLRLDRDNLAQVFAVT